MLNLLKQGVLTGVAVAGLTRDKVRDLAHDVAHRAGLDERETVDLEKQLARRREAERRTLGAEIDRRIDHAFVQAGIVRSGVGRIARESRSWLRNTIDIRIEQALDRTGVARRADVEALTRRVELLEKRLAERQETRSGGPAR